MIDRTEPMERVLVIVPTYNEAENITSIVRRIRAAVPGADVLIADDNSPDGTGQLADRLAGDDTHVHVLHRAGKEGLAKAYVAGFRWGLDHGYQVLVEHDADGSHQPEYLPAMLDALVDADMVKGSRWTRGGRVLNYSKRREALSRAANIWVQVAMDMPVHDATGGLNAFRAGILRAIDLDAVAGNKGYAFQIDLTRRVLDAGGVVREVPIEFPDRRFGQSKMSGAIIGEALVSTAAWGAAKRWAELRGLTQSATARLQPLAFRFREGMDADLPATQHTSKRSDDSQPAGDPPHHG